MALAPLSAIPSWVKTNRSGALICNMNINALSDIIDALRFEGFCITKQGFIEDALLPKIDEVVTSLILEVVSGNDRPTAEEVVAYFGIPMLEKQDYPFTNYSKIIKEMIISMISAKLISPRIQSGYVAFNRIWNGEVVFDNNVPPRACSRPRVKKLMKLIEQLPLNLVHELYEMIDAQVINTYTPVHTRAERPKELILQWDELLK